MCARITPASKVANAGAVDAAYGEILASAAFGETYYGTPVISDGVVYLNGFEGNTYAFGLLSNFNGANKSPHAPDAASLHPDFSLKIARPS